ncbi:winged helix-turn-helix transcriptional regulator [Propioniciclava coleopterorum]|uniref:Winged helix-turn-helix transcriptional regulator n=1 Tax=Propioniciclava coleopterorum TaxID=2714937 RepID=A0A6G7Y5D3_9ACTN|nr:winged helix-turn-helix domain-containing protein [Propioniciclava coleopterorum]QIK71919.1 winged helix-turn-helix transcriptional regulator [Propioniciclava coleopterorum]
MTEREGLEARVARLEEQVARLEAGRPAHAGQEASGRPPLGEDFHFLTSLEDMFPEPGAVLMVGSVTPAAGPVRWQVGQTLERLQEWDWTLLAPALTALAHPVRLTIMKLVLEGTETTGDLLAHPSLASTGKLHHHLRQLVSAGWLDATVRGRYTIPPERVVPLLMTVLSAHP